MSPKKPQANLEKDSKMIGLPHQKSVALFLSLSEVKHQWNTYAYI